MLAGSPGRDQIIIVMIAGTNHMAGQKRNASDNMGGTNKSPAHDMAQVHFVRHSAAQRTRHTTTHSSHTQGGVVLFLERA